MTQTATNTIPLWRRVLLAVALSALCIGVLEFSALVPLFVAMQRPLAIPFLLFAVGMMLFTLRKMMLDRTHLRLLVAARRSPCWSRGPCCSGFTG